MITVHLRQPLPRKGGNNFYRDRRIFTSHTYCGAPCGEFDVQPKDVTTKAGREFFAAKEAAGERQVCPVCKANAGIA